MISAFVCLKNKTIQGWIVTLICVTIQAVAPCFLSGCSSPETIEEINRPFGVVRATVKDTIPGGTRKVSENGREFDSNYFAPKGPFDTDGSTGNFRESAHIVILGSGRPYGIELECIVEKREGSSYEVYGKDSVRAKELAQRIRTGLSNRREDRNMIDEFKPF